VAKIRVLPDSVARKIAAGEVIERPASVVKELMENSLDAGAHRIVVEIVQGGRRRIAVTDDGEGIAREDAVVAFQPHATSKIRHDEDLRNISTLGFRGEALPSIAAMADVELWTCQQESDVGTHVRVHAGKPIVVEDAGTPPGCRIEVLDLFSATPARRKFLKAPATEAGHVAQLVGRFALARPEIAFELRQDQRVPVVFPPAGRRERIRRVLGAEIEAEMRTVEHHGAVRVAGFVTHPHIALSHSRHIFFFVNGRLVRDRLLQHALMAAYETFLPRGRYPGAVLSLEVPAEEVDVNVHPMKLEVRFRNGPAVHEAIGRAVREGLQTRSGVEAVAEARSVYAAESGAPDRSAMSAPPALRLVPPLAPGRRTEPFVATGSFSALRVVGQIFDGYLVCEGEGELWLIDQHAAHERVAFERLRAARSRGRVETQAMLMAQPVEVAAGDADLLSGAVEELAACGLEIEPFGDCTVLVRAVPALFPAASIAPLLRAVAADLADNDRSRALQTTTDALLATIACHSVVRVGQRLSEIEMRTLLAAMDEIEFNSNCPHGRPVARRMTRAELEGRFGR
jgi:DNA mismatch repair protein MutL